MGEIRAARREGSRQAASETAPITATAAARVASGSAGNPVIHRLEVMHRQFGVDVADQSLQFQSQRLWRKVGADDDEEVVVSAKGIRIVDRSLRGLVGQSGLFHGADNADDGEGLRIV